MKEILGTLLVLLCSGPALAASDVSGCEKHEYAEVNDMSTKDLLQEYCYNEGLVRVLGEGLHKMVGVQTVSETKKVQAAMSQCYNEQRKIKTVLTSRKEAVPSCK